MVEAMDDAMLSAVVPAKDGYELMIVVARREEGAFRALARQMPRNLSGFPKEFGHGAGETALEAMRNAVTALRYNLAVEEEADAAQASG